MVNTARRPEHRIVHNDFRRKAMQALAEKVEVVANELVVRDAIPADAERCARIFYDAFESIATRHNLPVEPSSPEFTRFKVSEMLTSAGFAGLVAERAGVVLGSAFVDERDVIVGIGPVTVDPAAQDHSAG